MAYTLVARMTRDAAARAAAEQTEFMHSRGRTLDGYMRAYAGSPAREIAAWWRADEEYRRALIDRALAHG